MLHLATQKVGDEITFSKTRGYKLVQDRRFNCRTVCACGECNGKTTTYEGVITKVIHWMDNSSDAEVLCTDGETRTTQLMYSHGDVCF